MENLKKLLRNFEIPSTFEKIVKFLRTKSGKQNFIDTSEYITMLLNFSGKNKI